jgi:hypothetical protein
MKISIQKLACTAFFITLSLFSFSTQSFAGKIATFTTSIEGNIANNEYNFTPYLAFEGDAPLYSTKLVTAADEGITFLIASDFDDVNYTTFINKLTNNEDEMLSIGHKIGKVKTDVSKKESDWFKGLNIDTKKITYISLTYTNLKFEASATDENEWTNFSYELVVSIFNDNDIDGIHFVDVNIDNDTDGIGFAFIDYEAAEQLEGTFTAKGERAETGKIIIKKVEEGIFIVVREDNENESNSKSVKIVFLSSTARK